VDLQLMYFCLPALRVELEEKRKEKEIKKEERKAADQAKLLRDLNLSEGQPVVLRAPVKGKEQEEEMDGDSAELEESEEDFYED
jgi:hypothetical protein